MNQTDELVALADRINESIATTEALLARMKQLHATVCNEIRKPTNLDAAFRAIMALGHASFADPREMADADSEPTLNDQMDYAEHFLGAEVVTIATERDQC